MSKNLTAAAITQFAMEVKHAYQGFGLGLRKYVKLKTGVKGGDYKFRTMGKGTATPRVPQTDVTPMNISHGRPQAILEDWNAPEYTDIFDAAEVDFDERQDLSRVIAGAIVRREEQLIIDALDAASTTLTVAKSVGGADTGLNPAKVRRADRLLNAKGVPRGRGQRLFLAHAVGKEQLLAETEVTSKDFVNVSRLVDGEIDHWMGFDFLWMEDRDEGGLDLTANTRTNFAGHREASGLAVGLDFRVEVNYIAEKTSWLSNGIFKAGAVAIDADGIVEVSTHEA